MPVCAAGHASSTITKCARSRISHPPSTNPVVAPRGLRKQTNRRPVRDRADRPGDEQTNEGTNGNLHMKETPCVDPLYRGSEKERAFVNLRMYVREYMLVTRHDVVWSGGVVGRSHSAEMGQSFEVTGLMSLADDAI